MISLIVAASENGVIGRDGELPWRQSDDLRRFKAVTMGKPIVMGRKTWESIGRPLPGRQNIVVSRQPGLDIDGADVVASASAAVDAARDADEIMIIGGSEIYALFMPLASRVYLTRVHAHVEGDAVFPALDGDWRLVHEERHPADENNDHDMSFRIYERTARS
jgi:dihydrofolate reductase